MNLEGKTALVTGASRGIGRAIALELAKKGADVLLNYNGSVDRAREVKAEIERLGKSAQLYPCDVADYSACETMFRDIFSEHSGLDILVNNAGITRDGLLMRMSEEAFDSVIDTNLKGTFHCMRFAARQMMKQRSGRIINLSSVVGVSGNAGQTNYAASKAGVIGLTKAGTDIYTDPCRQFWKNRRCCSCSGIFSVGRGRIYYRAGFACGRRNGDVAEEDI